MHPTAWMNMFHLDPAVSLLEKVLRPVLVYLFLVVGLRLAGKRELAQLNPFDLVVLLTLSNAVQNAIIGSDNSVVGGVIGATTLLLVNYLVVRFLYRHETIDRLVEGDTDHLVRQGVIQEDRLEKELITRTELEAAARKQGLGGLDEVEEAMIEPGGALVFTERKPAPEQARHRELMDRLAALSEQVHALEAKLGRSRSGGMA
jgi:uncharacterized membrane protein YcaP (DUF421 family)